MQIIVRESHRSNHPEPISFKRGERVKVGAIDTTYPGWIWTTLESGGSGWAPLELLEIRGEEAVATADYDATELDTEPGQILTVMDELAGWYQVHTEEGTIGWVPKDKVENATQ